MKPFRFTTTNKKIIIQIDRIDIESSREQINKLSDKIRAENIFDILHISAFDW